MSLESMRFYLGAGTSWGSELILIVWVPIDRSIDSFVDIWRAFCVIV